MDQTMFDIETADSSFQDPASHEMRALLDAVSKAQAVIHFDLDGIILDANENFLGAMGYTLDEIKGQHHRMFVEADYAKGDEYKDFWRTLGEGKFQSAEYKRLAKGGREIWIQGSYNPIFDESGKPYKVVKFATDITEQKLKNADYTGQINAINKSQAVIYFNLDGTIIDANENFLGAVGYALNEIKGQHHRIFVESDYAKSAEYAGFWRELGEGKFQAAEYKRLAKGGREVWIQASYNPIFDMNGKPYKVVKFATDVTDAVIVRRKKMEAQAAIAQELGSISNAIASATEQTSSAAAASEETNANVQAVAAGVEEFEVSIATIAESMRDSRRAADEAFERATTGDTATKRMLDAAQSMNGIVSMIQNIASQINLLSLNAAIEAARAGEAGRGFSVVANEVKSLANQAATATGQISGEIKDIQTVSTDVAKNLKEIQESLELVRNHVTDTSAAVEQQRAASREMAQNMQSAASAVAAINQNISHISVSTRNADEATRKVADMSKAIA